MKRLEITRAEAKKLVMLIKNGSLESGILVMLSLASTLVFKRKEKNRKKKEQSYSWDIRKHFI